MRTFPYAKVVTVAIFLVTLFVLSGDDVVSYLRGFMEGSVLGPLAFVVLLVAAVVLVPIAALPLVPFATGLFGPFFTGVLSVIGWTLGALIAFLIARHAGRPLLRYIVSLESVEKIETRIPKDASFLGVVLLRMIIPVDVLSYALGLLTLMPLRSYLLATLIGVTPFSFLFAYAGDAILSGSYLKLFGIMLAGGLIVLAVYRAYKKRYGIRR